MTTPSSSDKKPLDDYVGVECNGRKALIRRNPDFEATIQSIKDVFGALHEQLPTDIMLSAYIDGLGDYFAVPQGDWANLLPKVDCLTVGSTTRLPVPNGPPSSPVTRTKIEPKELPAAVPREKPLIPFITRTRSSSVISIHDSDDDDDLALKFGPHPEPSGASVKTENGTFDNANCSKRKRGSGEESEIEFSGRKTAGPSAYRSGVETKAQNASLINLTQPRAPVALGAAQGWSGQLRGRITINKRRNGPQTVTAGKWTFCKHGIALETVQDRSIGDIHFSLSASGSGYDHWVVEGESNPRWALHVEGDPHPTSSRYVLRSCYGSRPPGWVTPMGLYNNVKKLREAPY